MKEAACQANLIERCFKGDGAYVKKRVVASLLTLFSVAAVVAPPVLAKSADDIPDHLFIARKVPDQVPPAARPPRDRLISPPGEEIFYPIRTDGQAYVLNVDRTINLTQALNNFYYDPRWRGEVWTPFDQVDTIERATRLMSTWREYDEFSALRVLNNWHKFWEKYSGYGP